MPLSRRLEVAVDRFEHGAERAMLKAGNRQRRRLGTQRVVGVEVRPPRRRLSTQHAREEQRRRHGPKSKGIRHRGGLKASLNVQTILGPSFETAKSMRLMMAERSRKRSPMPPL